MLEERGGGSKGHAAIRALWCCDAVVQLLTLGKSARTASLRLSDIVEVGWQLEADVQAVGDKDG